MGRSTIISPKDGHEIYRRKCIQKESYDQIAKHMNYSRSGIVRYIERHPCQDSRPSEPSSVRRTTTTSFPQRSSAHGSSPENSIQAAPIVQPLAQKLNVQPQSNQTHALTSPIVTAAAPSNPSMWIPPTPTYVFEHSSDPAQIFFTPAQTPPADDIFTYMLKKMIDAEFQRQVASADAPACSCSAPTTPRKSATDAAFEELKEELQRERHRDREREEERLLERKKERERQAEEDRKAAEARETKERELLPRQAYDARAKAQAALEKRARTFEEIRQIAITKSNAETKSLHDTFETALKTTTNLQEKRLADDRKRFDENNEARDTFWRKIDATEARIETKLEEATKKNQMFYSKPSAKVSLNTDVEAGQAVNAESDWFDLGVPLVAMCVAGIIVFSPTVKKILAQQLTSFQPLQSQPAFWQPVRSFERSPVNDTSIVF